MKKLCLLLFCAITLLSGGPIFSMSYNPSNIDAVPAKPLPDSGTIHSALKEFMSLTRKERKERIKLAKAEIRNYKAMKKDVAEPSTNQLLLVILAILLPPLAVYLHEGTINNKFWLDLVLTLLFFIPGVIYALIVVLAK